MCRVTTFCGLILLGVSFAFSAEPVQLSTLKLDLEKLSRWKEKEYSFRIAEGGNPKDSLGKFILRTEVRANEIILRDTLEAIHRGNLVKLHVVQHCRKTNFLDPTLIVTRGEGDDELGTMDIKFDGKNVAAKSARGERKMEVESPVVTVFAFTRVVTLLPRVKGAMVKFAYWLEPEELNFKKDFQVECLGPDKAMWQGEEIAATKFVLSGGGIADAYYWVSDDGILRQVLADGRNVMQFEFDVPGNETSGKDGPK